MFFTVENILLINLVYALLFSDLGFHADTHDIHSLRDISC